MEQLRGMRRQTANLIEHMAYEQAQGFINENKELIGQLFPDNKDLLDIFNDLQARLYSRKGESEKAIELMQKVVEQTKETQGEGDQETILHQEDLAEIFYESQKFEEALTLFRKCFELRLETPQNNFFLMENLMNTQKCLRDLNRTEEALQVLQKAFDLVEPIKEEDRGQFFLARLSFSKGLLF